MFLAIFSSFPEKCFFIDFSKTMADLYSLPEMKFLHVSVLKQQALCCPIAKVRGGNLLITKAEGSKALLSR